jgi:hypothetical protein
MAGNGRHMLGAAFGIRAWTAEFHDEAIGIWVQFGRDDGGICYELVTPLHERCASIPG